MTGEVRDAYDAMAQEYATFALDDLERVPTDRIWLEHFAELTTAHKGPVADLGCGPGHVTSHLAEMGLATFGIDISSALISNAQTTFPGLCFVVGDLSALAIADSSLGGIVARYSLIHIVPTTIGEIFDEWQRVLEPGAPILVSFFAAPSDRAHGSPFDHAVATAYALFPESVADKLRLAGFGEIEVVTRQSLTGERPLYHATILAQRL